mmetsp:Transcript_17315/g.51189  ORF Transcript_17315/g.51189 Transcript_17315/m.51189 type:complete len:250 (+) Transcript_17315:390-1139(+)
MVSGFALSSTRARGCPCESDTRTSISPTLSAHITLLSTRTGVPQRWATSSATTTEAHVSKSDPRSQFFLPTPLSRCLHRPSRCATRPFHTCVARTHRPCAASQAHRSSSTAASTAICSFCARCAASIWATLAAAASGPYLRSRPATIWARESAVISLVMAWVRSRYCLYDGVGLSATRSVYRFSASKRPSSLSSSRTVSHNQATSAWRCRRSSNSSRSAARNCDRGDCRNTVAVWRSISLKSSTSTASP